MTVPQLIHECRRAGFSLFCRPDGQPVFKPLREGARMPEKLLATLKDYRGLISEFFVSTARRDWEACSVCQANISIDLTPEDARTICDRVPVNPHGKVQGAAGCPYRDFSHGWRDR